MSYDAEAKEELHAGIDEYSQASAAELYKSTFLLPFFLHFFKYSALEKLSEFASCFQLFRCVSIPLDIR